MENNILIEIKTKKIVYSREKKEQFDVFIQNNTKLMREC